MRNAKSAIKEEILKRKKELSQALDDLIDLQSQRMYYVNKGDSSRTVDYLDGRISTFRNHENVLIGGIAQLKRIYIMVSKDETIETLQLDLTKSDFTKELRSLRPGDFKGKITDGMFKGYDRSIDEKNYA